MWNYQHQHFCVHQFSALNDNYLYAMETEHDIIVIDPAIAQPVIALSETLKKPVSVVLNTHHHWDHTDGNIALKEHFNCQIIASTYDAPRTPAIDKTAEATMQISGLTIQVLDVPGHTLGHVAYLINDALFCGDTLFGAGCGRLFEGTAAMMWQSLGKIAALDPATQIYCAHEYTLMNLKFARTVDTDNPALKQRISSDTRQRMQKKPTIPSKLALEHATNPFLRPLDPLFCQTYAKKHQTSTDACAVFSDIRQRRDCYSA